MTVTFSESLFQNDDIMDQLKKASHTHVMRDSFFLLRCHEQFLVTVVCHEVYYNVCLDAFTGIVVSASLANFSSAYLCWKSTAYFIYSGSYKPFSILLACFRRKKDFFLS